MNPMPMSETRTGERRRIVVAMSGGVDSSVAAALLVDQGHEVIGMMLRLWSEPGTGTSASTNRCCTPDQMADARRVADRLGIPFYVVDAQQHFRQAIVQFFIREHEAGRTPNPCVECNRQIRFTYLLERAMALGADYLVTGHYARVSQVGGKYRLLQGLDSNKDQSYVLYTLRQDQLARVFFPIGDYAKPEVRDLARQYGLLVASKRESQDLCFLKDGDYRRFLRENSLQVQAAGPILDEDGHELGQHEGLAFYTIGQRKGLGIAAAEPLFVLRKDPERNALIVGPRTALGVRDLVATGVNWISGEVPAAPFLAQVKIRYKATALEATVWPIGADQARVRFAEPAFGVTSGQAAVFYDGEACLGGGLIANDQALEIMVEDDRSGEYAL